MTTEEDFQKALDANPDDWQTRLVFADWLQERDDPRAEGYRALGVRRKFPVPSRGFVVKGPKDSWEWHNCLSSDSVPHAQLGDDWSRFIQRGVLVWDSRQEAEDAAALAFSMLIA